MYMELYEKKLIGHNRKYKTSGNAGIAVRRKVEGKN